MDFNQAQLGAFLNILGIHFRNDNGWLRFKCWFSKMKHQNGTDSNPSACIEISNPGYYCHSCQTKYPKTEYALQGLLRDLSSHGLNADKVLKVLNALESGQLSTPTGSGKATDAEEKFVAYPDSYINGYPPVSTNKEALKFLASRYVGNAQIDSWNIRLDPVEQRVLIPYKNKMGKYAGMVGRDIHATEGKDKQKRYRRYVFENHGNRLVWPNENNLTSELPVVVVEGIFDLLRIQPYFPNVTALLGSQAKADKLKLLKNFVMGGTYVFSDRDISGDRVRKEIRQYCATNYIATYDMFAPAPFKDASALPIHLLLPVLKPVLLESV